MPSSVFSISFRFTFCARYFRSTSNIVAAVDRITVANCIFSFHSSSLYGNQKLPKHYITKHEWFSAGEITFDFWYMNVMGLSWIRIFIYSSINFIFGTYQPFPFFEIIIFCFIFTSPHPTIRCGKVLVCNFCRFFSENLRSIEVLRFAAVNMSSSVEKLWKTSRTNHTFHSLAS